MIRSSTGGFFDVEQGFAGYPAVGYGFIPGFTSPALTYDYVETVVFQVQGLTGTLYTVSYNSNGFVFQYLELLLPMEILLWLLRFLLLLRN